MLKIKNPEVREVPFAFEVLSHSVMETEITRILSAIKRNFPVGKTAGGGRDLLEKVPGEVSLACHARFWDQAGQMKKERTTRGRL